MKKILFFVFSLCAFSLFAKGAVSIEELMTNEEQKRTGIHKLSIYEKMELKSWVESYCKKKSSRSLQKNLPEILQVIRQGHFLVLTDKSIWQIHPDDTKITHGWITPAPIRVEKTTRGSFPYTLTNEITKSSVRARKITHIPEQHRSHIEFNPDRADYRKKDRP